MIIPNKKISNSVTLEDMEMGKVGEENEDVDLPNGAKKSVP